MPCLSRPRKFVLGSSPADCALLITRMRSQVSLISCRMWLENHDRVLAAQAPNELAQSPRFERGRVPRSVRPAPRRRADARSLARCRCAGGTRATASRSACDAWLSSSSVSSTLTRFSTARPACRASRSQILVHRHVVERGRSASSRPCRAPRGRSTTSSPPTRTFPLVGGRSVARMRRVALPAPFAEQTWMMFAFLDTGGHRADSPLFTVVL